MLYWTALKTRSHTSSKLDHIVLLSEDVWVLMSRCLVGTQEKKKTEQNFI